MTNTRLKLTKIVMSFVFLLLISSIIVNIDNVLAVDIGGDAGGDDIDVGVGCTDGWCWPTNRPSGNFYAYYGVRVSIYDSNANKIGNSLDFAPDDYEFVDLENITLKATGQKKSKLEYIEEGGAPDYNSWSTYDNKWNLITGTNQIEDLFPDDDAYLCTNIFECRLGMETAEEVKSWLRRYEGSFGTTIETLFTDPEKYYIIIEPITILQYKENSYDREIDYYYGTYTELLNIYQETGAEDNFKSIRILFKNPANEIGTSIHLMNSNLVVGSDAMSELLNRLKNESGDTAIDNKYGIGVLWLGKYDEPERETEDDGCNVRKPFFACEDTISFGYENCLLTDADEVRHHYDDSIICNITCTESYTLDVRHFYKVFNGIGTSYNGILAGSYVDVNGFSVEHEKECKYKYDQEALDSATEAEITYRCWKEEPRECGCIDYADELDENMNRICISWEEGPCTNRVFDYECQAELLDYKVEKYEMGDCGGTSGLEQKYKEMNADEDANSDADNQGNLPLDTGFSEYLLDANLDDQEIDDSDTSYYYFNKFNYQISGTINKYIDMHKVHQIDDPENMAVIKTNDSAMISTPIKAISKGPDGYSYFISYENVLNDDFKNFMESKEADFSVFDPAECEYTLFQRNIKTYCDTRGDCDYSDDTFHMPAIRMVFRPIDLTIPFPGQNFTGSQRNPGPNWSNEDVLKYIINTADDVYSEEPIYVIELDANDIRNIRDYNDTHAYDDFTLECTDGEGTECFSDFISDYVTDGTCSGVGSIDFYSCAGKEG